MDPEYDASAYMRVVTQDASAPGGAPDACKQNYYAAQPKMIDLAATSSGLALLSSAFRTCEPLKSVSEVEALLEWTQDPWADMAMGEPWCSHFLLTGAMRKFQ